jgi:nitrate reductase NapAB chaperone NapD
MLYTGIGALLNNLSQKYFEHFCLYVLCIRVLCDSSRKVPLRRVQDLIFYWHQQLKIIYDEQEMTFTAHAHIHLPQQVHRFGPLHKISAFPFESMLKKLKMFITGPTNIGEQVSNRFVIERIAREKLINSAQPEQFLQFIKNIINDPIDLDKKDDGSLFNRLNVELDFDDLLLINNYCHKTIDPCFIESFGKCYIIGQTFYSKLVEESIHKCSSYVEYEVDGLMKYGRIIKFVQISKQSLFYVEEFIEKLDIPDVLDISCVYHQILKTNHFNDYFKVFKRKITSKSIHNINKLKKICILVGFGNNIIITPTLEFEHD